MNKADFCVFIGRFQPIHSVHLRIIEEAFREANEVIIVIGSHNSPEDFRNPWSSDFRRDLIVQTIGKSLPVEKLHFTYVRDYLYSDIGWLTAVQNNVQKITGHSSSSKIIGAFKDDASYFLSLFPQWKLVSQPYVEEAHATEIRKSWLENRPYPTHTPPNVVASLEAQKGTRFYNRLLSEYTDTLNFRSSLSSSPYPPTFVTVDSVVVQAGHILLIERGNNPGKGKLALPGGYLQENKSILDSCLAELREETNILIPTENLKASLTEVKTFDHPQRDLRGRFITHAHFFNINTFRIGPLPQVRGGDDAANAFWLPLADLYQYERDFYSDHLHIISYFVHGVGR